jgi:hypothetical protein
VIFILTIREKHDFELRATGGTQMSGGIALEDLERNLHTRRIDERASMPNVDRISPTIVADIARQQLHSQVQHRQF